MPIGPPPVEERHVRFDPIFVSQDDLEDLATFTGMGLEECLQRLRSYSLEEHANAWRTADPKTPEDIVSFYRSTDLYVWELMQWHASAHRRPYWQALEWLVENYPPGPGRGRIYDLGCGVGTDALFLASKGYEVTAVDVGGPTFEFAKHRFARRRLQAHFIESASSLPEPPGMFAAAVCFDVFEHLPDPLSAARQLVDALEPGGILLQQGTFDEGDEAHPCHLAEGTRAYSGLRWNIHLAGLGLRPAGPMALRKDPGLASLLQRGRYLIWKATGLWVAQVPRR